MEELNRIALTGSTGSIGLEFPKKCSKLYTRLESSINKMIFEINRLKIKPKTLIHLSALVSTKNCERNPKKAYELNVLGAMKWYHASKYTGIKNFIFISTSHVYKSIKSENVKINYGFETRPNNIYGKSKLIAEKKLKNSSKIKGYPNLVIIRIFSVLSLNARKNFLVNDLLKKKRTKDYSTIYGVNIQRDFLESSTIAKRILNISLSRKKKKIYHVCSGKSKTIGQISKQILGNKFYNKCKKKKISDTNWLSLIGKETFII